MPFLRGKEIRCCMDYGCMKRVQIHPLVVDRFHASSQRAFRQAFRAVLAASIYLIAVSQQILAGCTKISLILSPLPKKKKKKQKQSNITLTTTK